MKKAMPEAGQLIASTMTGTEYRELEDRADRILKKIPAEKQGSSRSRTVGELFRSMDKSFEIVGSRTRKKSS